MLKYDIVHSSCTFSGLAGKHPSKAGFFNVASVQGFQGGEIYDCTYRFILYLYIID